MRGSRSQSELGQEGLHPVNISGPLLQKHEKQQLRRASNRRTVRSHTINTTTQSNQSHLSSAQLYPHSCRKKTNHNASGITCMYGDCPRSPVRQFGP